ncbi:HAD family hydrolase [Coralloluteibacterium thermophilus]|uniref:HAD family hydrolase n=1 Tax=Coralloluteibacterium thermophilum TaxID=2707049 RepID=A0ABV9NH43_9GAMM
MTAHPRPPRAVLFDVFGTLARIGAPRHPYRGLLRALARTGRAPQREDRRLLMSRPLDLAQAAEALGGGCPDTELARLQAELDGELASIRLFPDAAPTLHRLRAAGLRIGLCSNLSLPYAAPVQRLLPVAVDASLWSFEVGALKPEPAIFDAACRALAVPPEDVLMVGDTLAADWHGPRAAGMRALHLVRHGVGVTPDGIASLAELPARLGVE